MKKSLFGLVPFLSAAIEKLKKLLPEKGISLSYDPPSDSVLILGDEQRLFQVLEHLIKAGVTLFKPSKIQIHIKSDVNKKASVKQDSVQMDLAFTGSWSHKPEALFNWDSPANIPGRVRFSMQLSRLCMKLMEGDLTVTRSGGRIVFHLDLRKEEL